MSRSAATSAAMLHTGDRTLHGKPARFAGGMVEVAPRTFAWLQPNGDWSESNAGLIVGDDAATLVDTAWDLPLTRQLLADIADRTSAPITTLVLTHGDGDHVNGAQLLPDAEVVASEATAADMQHEDPAGLRRSKAGARLLATMGIGPAQHFGKYLTAMFAPFDLAGVKIRTPDRTFAERLDLVVGGRELELIRLGPAHTAGDTIIHVPDVRTVFAGDLLFSGVTPNSWSGSVSGWRRALAAIDALEPEIVVPGHGPVGDRAALTEFDAYWAWLDEHARKHLSAGLSVDDAARRIVTSDDFAASPWADWESPERTVLNVVIIDRERRGVPTAISHGERPRLMWKVAALARHLARHTA